MSAPMPTTIDRTYLKRATRGRVLSHVTVAIFLIAAVLASTFALFIPNVAKMSTSYAKTAAVVEHEGSTTVTVGSKYNRHQEQRRTILVSYPFGGSETSTELMSDTGTVGGSIDVWVDQKDGTAYLEKPTITPLDAGFMIGAALLILVLAIVLVVGISRTRRVTTFSPHGRTPELWVQLQRMDTKRTNPKRRLTEPNTTLGIFGAVVRTSTMTTPVGAEVAYAAPLLTTPGAAIGPDLVVFRVRETDTSRLRVLHDTVNGTWWLATSVNAGAFHANIRL